MQFQNSISYLIHFRFCYSHFDISLHNYLVISSCQKKYHKVTKWCNALLASSFQRKARHKYSPIEYKELQVTVCHPKSGSLFLKKICVSWSFKFISKNTRISTEIFPTAGPLQSLLWTRLIDGNWKPCYSLSQSH